MQDIKYPHYRRLGPLKLLLEPYVFLLLGAISAGVLFVVNHSSRTQWVTLAALFLIAYLASYARRSCAFKHVLQQISSVLSSETQDNSQ